MRHNQINQNSTKRNNNQNKLKKTSKELYPDEGYGSSGTRYQNNNNFKNDVNNYNIQNNNFSSQNYKYPNENQTNDNVRPLWSYREIKYDHNKQPMNSEEITTQKIPRKSNLEQLQEDDQKYFNNMRYQKVKVTKKVKNIGNVQPKIQKKGPMDDYEQQYNIQNNNYEQLNQPNIENIEHHENENHENENHENENENNNMNENNQLNNFNENYEQNIEDMNNEDDEEGEIELAQKDIQDEYDKIIDDNGQNNNNNQNLNNNIEEEQKEQLNNLQNQMQNNEINDEEFQKENYDLDIENLAEVNSDNEKEENKNLQGQQQNYNQNQNNEIETNNQTRPMPTFNETITQKVTDIIEDAKIFPEGNLESWNCVADYTP